MSWSDEPPCATHPRTKKFVEPVFAFVNSISERFGFRLRASRWSFVLLALLARRTHDTSPIDLEPPSVKILIVNAGFPWVYLARAASLGPAAFPQVDPWSHR